MVQIVREEGDEEYWQRPLREAIVNVGNSWAGSVVRRQNSAANYAKEAANRAHEAYIAQIGINSREKIAGAQLAATKARNETLNKQFAASSKIQQSREKRDADMWAYQQSQDLKEVDATAASQVILSSMKRSSLRVSVIDLVTSIKSSISSSSKYSINSAALSNSTLCF